MCYSLPLMLRAHRDGASLWPGTVLEHPLGMVVSAAVPSIVAVSPTSRACPHPITKHQTLQKVQLPYQLPRAGESKQDVPHQRRGADESSLACGVCQVCESSRLCFCFPFVY